MIEGKRVELSGETIKNLKKALGIDNMVRVDTFRAAKVKGNPCPYLIGALTDDEEWNRKWMDNAEGHIHWYSEDELKQIIAGLQELLAS